MKVTVTTPRFLTGLAGVDGCRCDVAGFAPLDFLETARAKLDKIKPVFNLSGEALKVYFGSAMTYGGHQDFDGGAAATVDRDTVLEMAPWSYREFVATDRTS